MKKYLDNHIFRIISELSKSENIEVYVIGGHVRDYYLNRHSSDIDIVCIGSGITFARKLAASLNNNVKVNIFKNFGTAKINYQGLEIEFVGARKESYSRDSRKPVVENGSLQDDLNRRDFTINAMAISLNPDNFGEMLDPFNGLADLKNRIIQTPHDPVSTFIDDPLRILRAIRFACQLDFTISELTFNAIKENKTRISIISKERIIEEINKILLSPVPSKGFYLLDESGLLEIIFPELSNLKGVDIIGNKGHKDNFLHTLRVIDNISQKTNKLWLKWAGLFHDIGKPTTKKLNPENGWTFHGHNEVGARMIPEIFKKLKMPMNEKMKFVQKMVSLHMRPIVLAQETVTDSAIRRLLFEAGDDIDDLMILCMADVTSRNRLRVKKYRENFNLVKRKLKEIEEKDRIRNWQPPVSGNDIMECFGLSQSKEIGVIKNAIREAILDGHIKNDRKEALNFMIEKAKELGLKPGNEN